MKLEEFIKTQIESVDQLRTLLLLRMESRTEWEAMSVAGKLYLQPPLVVSVLNGLVAKGLVVCSGEPLRYRYHPQTPELAELVEELAALDREHPVTLINMIYDQAKGIQAFADAFKLKNMKKD